MSELVQIRKKAQVTLPLSVRKELGIEEGDFLDIRVENREIVLRVKKLVDKDQAWFWTERWQKGEREADQDIRAGPCPPPDRSLNRDGICPWPANRKGRYAAAAAGS